MIQNIDISKIFPHPDNPRKELGDITELADSIKANGIFQNLTVVPQLAMTPGYCTSCDLYNGAVGKCKNDYDKSERPPCSRWVVRSDFLFTVVIGHRRLAAAKLAGLTEVPCAISKMDYKKQISTMLLENMQRNDLTVYEQAQGFQMMLNLGESINDISESTGFSESTVRRRVKLLDFDQEKFRQSVERGGTLLDYAEMEKIKDIERRNSVLDTIGTENFRWTLRRALDEEKSEENKALIIAELEKFATQTKETDNLKYVGSYYPSQDMSIVIPEDADSVEYFYVESAYGRIELYQKGNGSGTNKSPQKDPAWLKEQRERDERRTALNEISNRAYQLRREFVLSVSNTTAKKNISVITEYLLRALINDDYYPDLDEFADFLGIEIDEEVDEWTFDNIKDQVTTQPERHLFVATYLMLDSEHENYYDWENRYEKNETLDLVYAFLEKLGYEISEEEASMCDGTHSLLLSENKQI